MHAYAHTHSHPNAYTDTHWGLQFLALPLLHLLIKSKCYSYSRALTVKTFLPLSFLFLLLSLSLSSVPHPLSHSSALSSTCTFSFSLFQSQFLKHLACFGTPIYFCSFLFPILTESIKKLQKSTNRNNQRWSKISSLHLSARFAKCMVRKRCEPRVVGLFGNAE